MDFKTGQSPLLCLAISRMMRDMGPQHRFTDKFGVAEL